MARIIELKNDKIAILTPYNTDVLFVGDRPEDEAAARDAGVRFEWADQFFGG